MSFLPVIAMGAGVVGVVQGGWKMWEGEGSLRWPKVTGVVESTRVESHGGGKGPRWYSAEVSYGYQAGDHWYRGDRWSYGRDNWFATYEEAEAFAANYREAAPIEVYHHPTVPSRSVLVPGSGNAGLAIAGFFAALFLGGLYAYLAG